MSRNDDKLDLFCDVSMIHEAAVRQVFDLMPEPAVISELSDLFKVFGDPTRVRILHALSISELCVCDLSAILSMSQSAVSHQLRVLKTARLVKNRRDGKVIYYSLLDEHVRSILKVGSEHIAEDR